MRVCAVKYTQADDIRPGQEKVHDRPEKKRFGAEN